MNRYARLIVGFLVLVVIRASAQPVPDSLKTMFPTQGGKPRQLVLLKQLTVAQREFLWQDTRVDPRGYLRISVSPDYIKQMTNLEILDDLEYPAALSRSSVLGRTFRGAKHEGKNRVNYLFVGKTGTEAMITSWNFKKDGASITVVQDFLNQSVNGMPATLSLAISNGTRACLWKLTASDEEKLFEVVILDSVESNNEPHMTVQEVLAAARQLIGLAQSAS